MDPFDYKSSRFAGRQGRGDLGWRIPFVLLSLVSFLATGCCTTPGFSQKDADTIGDLGGYYLPENQLNSYCRAAEVRFRPQKHLLNDDEFAAAFPSIMRMSPYILDLSDQPISDRSIELLRQLPDLRILYIGGTHVTEGELRKLNPRVETPR